MVSAVAATYCCPMRVVLLGGAPGIGKTTTARSLMELAQAGPDLVQWVDVDALAERPDVSWVTVDTAGCEVTCAVRSLSSRDREHLLVQRLPQTAAVTG